MKKVYFIQAGKGPIKIGTSSNPRKSMVNLQSSNASEIVLLATIPGGVKEARELHERFAELRLRGEWFIPADDLLSYIGNINAAEGGAGGDSTAVSMMKRFLMENNISQALFARQHKISEATVSRIFRGERLPTSWQILCFQRGTLGTVTLEDWYRDREQP